MEATDIPSYNWDGRPSDPRLRVQPLIPQLRVMLVPTACDLREVLDYIGGGR